MPYIDPMRRGYIEDVTAKTVGDLTYLIQQLLNAHLEENGVRYHTLAECLGALEGAKADFISRILIPYEKAKCLDNGDVWSEEVRRATGSF